MTYGSPNMSDTTLLVSVEDLINMAMGPSDVNVVNFKMVQTVLHILARQMRLLETRVEIRVSEAPPPKVKKEKARPTSAADVSSKSPRKTSPPKQMKQIKEERVTSGRGREKDREDRGETRAMAAKEREGKLAAKEKDKAERATSKEREKAERVDAKERDKAERATSKEREKAERADAKERDKAERATSKEREKAERADAKERDKAERATSKEREKAERADAKEKEKADRDASKEREKAERADAKAKEKAEQATSKEREKAERADAKEKEKADRDASKEREKAERADAKAKEKAEQATSKEREKAERADAKEKDKADRDASKERERAERADAKEKEKADRDASKEREKAERADAKAKEKAEQASSKEREKAERAEAKEKDKAERADEKEKEKAERADAKEKDKADRDASKERERAERADAKEKEKADRDASKEREKAERADAKDKDKAERATSKEREKEEKAQSKEREKAEREASKERAKQEKDRDKAVSAQEKAALKEKEKEERDISRQREKSEKKAVKEREEAERAESLAREKAEKRAIKATEKAERAESRERAKGEKSKEREEREQSKEREKAEKSALKEKEKMEKMDAKERERYEKEKEKAEKAAAKEQEKLEKMSAKEREKYEKEAAKELERAEKAKAKEDKENAKEQEKLEKMSAKEREKYEKEAAKELERAEKAKAKEDKEKAKEQEKLEKMSAKEREKYEKEAAKELERAERAKAKDDKKSRTASGTGISIKEVDRQREKVLVVEKGPTTRVDSKTRVGSIEVVTQSQFELLEAAVEELKQKAGPLPLPALPDNKKLRSELAKGSASLTDTMQAMQVSARVQAAEAAVGRMAGLLTQLAAAGALPRDMVPRLEEVTAEMDAAEESIKQQQPSGPHAHKSVAIDPMSKKEPKSAKTDAKPLMARASVTSRASAQSKASMPSAGVTHIEMDDALRGLKEDLAKNVNNLTMKATAAAELASVTAKAVADKLDVAVKLNSRISTLYSLVSDYAEQLSGFDAGLTTQMQSFQEQMMQMRTDLKGGITQLEAANANSETAAVMELTERYEGLVSELDMTLLAHKNLTCFQTQLGDELRSLLECVETLREQKADRDEVLDGLRDKADNSRLAGLLTEADFALSRVELERRLDMCYDKFRRQELVWMGALKDLSQVADGKAELMQLMAARDDAQQQLRDINDQLMRLAIMLGEPKAAMVTRQLSRGARCGACQVPALQEPVDANYGKPPLLPAARPPPAGEEAPCEPAPCEPQWHLERPPDEREHTCHRWVGGSHTLLLPESLAREQAGPLHSNLPPTRKYTGYGNDGRLYMMEEELQPCLECNMISTDNQPAAAPPTGAGDGGPQTVELSKEPK